MELRRITADDRDPLARLLARVENFTEDERQVALELIDASIARPDGDYECIVAIDAEGTARDRPEASADAVVGYLCFGPTPMTEWTYDLYWVAVDAALRGRGLGKALVARFESLVAERGGRIARIETSSVESYGGTLEFYLRSGYEVVGRIPDFYRAQDDLITLAKRLPLAAE